MNAQLQTIPQPPTEPPQEPPAQPPTPQSAQPPVMQTSPLASRLSRETIQRLRTMAEQLLTTLDRDVTN